MKQIVFFASGSGTNFQSVIDAVEAGVIDARITGLIVNKSGTGALKRARRHNIPVQVLNPASFPEPQNYEETLLETLKKWAPDLIVLAGYLLKIPSSILRAYSGKIINIHPSLLPKYGGKGFYGMHVHTAVLDNDDEETGCSVHIVTEEYDQGPVIAQRTVPVYKTDTPQLLADRVLVQEHQLLPEAINQFFTNSNS